MKTYNIQLNEKQLNYILQKLGFDNVAEESICKDIIEKLMQAKQKKCTNFQKFKDEITIKEAVNLIQSRTVEECKKLIGKCDDNRYYTCGQCIKNWLESEAKDG